MTNFMDRLMGKKPLSPAQSAKDRLKFVLITDRTTVAPEDLKKMQAEIIDVIRKYCRINEDDVELKFEQRERESFLVADIPLKPIRTGEQGGSIRLETTLSPADEDDEDKKDTKEAPQEDMTAMPDVETERIQKMDTPPIPDDEPTIKVDLSASEPPKA